MGVIDSGSNVISPEEKMIQEMEAIAIENANRLSDEDKITELYTKTYPTFVATVEGLGKQDLIQLVIELVKLPGGEAPKFYHPKTAFAGQIGGMLLNLKSTILLKANLEVLMEAYNKQKTENGEELPSVSENNTVTQEKGNNNG